MISAKELRKISDKVNLEKNKKLGGEWLAKVEQELLKAAELGATQYVICAYSDDIVLTNTDIRNDIMKTLSNSFGYTVQYEDSSYDDPARLIIKWDDYQGNIMADNITRTEAEQNTIDDYIDNLPKGLIDWIIENIRDFSIDGKSSIRIREEDLERESLKKNGYPIEDRWDLHDLKGIEYYTEVNKKIVEYHFFRESEYVEEVSHLSREVTLVYKHDKRLKVFQGIAEWARLNGFDVSIEDDNLVTWISPIDYIRNKSISIRWHNETKI